MHRVGVGGFRVGAIINRVENSPPCTSVYVAIDSMGTWSDAATAADYSVHIDGGRTVGRVSRSPMD